MTLSDEGAVGLASYFTKDVAKTHRANALKDTNTHAIVGDTHQVVYHNDLDAGTGGQSHGSYVENEPVQRDAQDAISVSVDVGDAQHGGEQLQQSQLHAGDAGDEDVHEQEAKEQRVRDERDTEDRQRADMVEQRNLEHHVAERMGTEELQAQNAREEEAREEEAREEEVRPKEVLEGNENVDAT